MSYVPREIQEAPSSADNPPAMSPNPPYIIDNVEMTARAPHTKIVGGIKLLHDDFVIDSARVWILVASITRGKACWTVVKPFQRKKGGRGGVLGLWNHYLRPNMIDKLATRA